MDKDFILKYLRVEHLATNSELLEIAEGSGLEVVKPLLKNHEQMGNLYIPLLTSNKALMCAVIADNRDKMTVRQLATITGLNRRRVQQLINEMNENSN